MARMNVSLPAAMKAWVESQTDDGRYGNSSDVVRDLIRKAQIREEKIANMNRLVEEGLASGISDKTVSQIIAEARQEALSRQAAKNCIALPGKRKSISKRFMRVGLICSVLPKRTIMPMVWRKCSTFSRIFRGPLANDPKHRGVQGISLQIPSCHLRY